MRHRLSGRRPRQPPAHLADQQRMPRRAQLHAAVDGDIGRDAVDQRSEARLRLQHVELDGDVERGPQIRRPRAGTRRSTRAGCAGPRHVPRSSSSTMSLLISTVPEGSRKSVAPLAELPWTMPGTLPRCSARTISTIAAVALGDDLVLQILGVVLAAHELLERGAEARPLVAAAGRGCCATRAGVVEHLAAGIDRVAHRCDLGLEARRPRRDRAEDRKRPGGLPDRRPRDLHRVEKVRERPQRQRLEQLPLDLQTRQSVRPVPPRRAAGTARWLRDTRSSRVVALIAAATAFGSVAASASASAAPPSGVSARPVTTSTMRSNSRVRSGEHARCLECLWCLKCLRC